ncbi:MULTISPECIES: hypothetical protein [unclassified Acinetobacter]|uniref:hypothetical protein n=1 Tax=unclassified Acinetobacter TaxID=196816 RepID=UPI0025C1E57F|nr:MULTISPECIES: hypothetical protein [unclassified Acinetobacter]
MIDELLDREFRHGYTCNEFACEAWKLVTGEDLSQRLELFLNGGEGFERLDKPISPCLVFFHNSARSETHIGLFYEGRVLHLAARGAQYVPLEFIVGYKYCEFYQ